MFEDPYGILKLIAIAKRTKLKRNKKDRGQSIYNLKWSEFIFISYECDPLDYLFQNSLEGF